MFKRGSSIKISATDNFFYCIKLLLGSDCGICIVKLRGRHTLARGLNYDRSWSFSPMDNK